MKRKDSIYKAEYRPEFLAARHFFVLLVLSTLPLLKPLNSLIV